MHTFDPAREPRCQCGHARASHHPIWTLRHTGRGRSGFEPHLDGYRGCRYRRECGCKGYWQATENGPPWR